MKKKRYEAEGRNEYRSGKCLTEEEEILSRWTEYCSNLYNYESCGHNAILDCSQPPEEELHDDKVSISGRNITNLRFGDEMDALAEEEQNLEALVKSIDKTCTR